MLPDPAYAGYRAGSALARLLPEATVQPVSDGLGHLGSLAFGGRRAMVARHQRRIAPELSEREVRAAVRATFSSYARYWIESFRLPGTPPDVLDHGIEVEGWEHVQAGLDAGTGAILALPHLGGWEWAGFWVTAVRHAKVTVVAEAVEPKELADWFIGLREEFGMEVIQLGPDAGSRVARALKDNRVVCLLCDRDLAGGGVEVEFFGEKTTLPGGPATLALRSGAPLLPTATYYEGGGRHGIVRPPLDMTRHGKLREDVVRITQELAAELELLIRRAPDQWHLMQPNWPSDHRSSRPPFFDLGR
ncbi:MAG: putative acyltransferase [Acidimicrobiales bacterium]|nr:putative acyltransferase [Acidimicrobiales bacterium]